MPNLFDLMGKAASGTGFGQRMNREQQRGIENKRYDLREATANRQQAFQNEVILLKEIKDPKEKSKRMNAIIQNNKDLLVSGLESHLKGKGMQTTAEQREGRDDKSLTQAQRNERNLYGRGRRSTTAAKPGINPHVQNTKDYSDILANQKIAGAKRTPEQKSAAAAFMEKEEGSFLAGVDAEEAAAKKADTQGRVNQKIKEFGGQSHLSADVQAQQNPPKTEEQMIAEFFGPNQNTGFGGESVQTNVDQLSGLTPAPVSNKDVTDHRPLFQGNFPMQGATQQSPGVKEPQTIDKMGEAFAKPSAQQNLMELEGRLKGELPEGFDLRTDATNDPQFYTVLRAAMKDGVDDGKGGRRPITTAEIVRLITQGR